MNLKKLIILIFLMIVLTTLLTGCRNKKQMEFLSKETSSLKQNNAELTKQVFNLEEENKKIKDENNELKKENDKLKSNGKVVVKPNKSDESNKEKIAYLTFDDGPSENTEKILDTLKENNIKATFFVNGNPNKAEIYKRIARDGHTIGNHTYSHDYKTVYSTIDGFNADVKKLNDFITKTTGQTPKILRFPGGSNNQVSYSYGGKDFMDKITQEVKKEGIVYFDWNVSSTDAEKVTQNKQTIINSTLEEAKGKSKAIILMHDSKPKTTTVEALPEIIKGLKEQGFKFAPLTPNVSPVQFK